MTKLLFIYFGNIINYLENITEVWLNLCRNITDYFLDITVMGNL